MVQFEILSEHEIASGWQYEVQVLDDEGGLHRHVLHLSWADYNLWSSDGADPPAHVATAAMDFLLNRRAPSELRASLDASLARRLESSADTEIPRRIRGS